MRGVPVLPLQLAFVLLGIFVLLSPYSDVPDRGSLTRSGWIMGVANAETVSISRDALISSLSTEVSMGSPDAPVYMVEYASLTCHACAQFHTIVLPVLKEKYIETGKLLLIMRPFPLDPVSAGAAMLTYCAGKDRYFKVVDVLFREQANWARQSQGDSLSGLFSILKQTGFTKKEFDACISNQEILTKIAAIKKNAEDKFSVRSTPTFFINGKAVEGFRSAEELGSLIDQAVSDAKK